MTPEERRRLKEAINARQRELVVDDGRKYHSRDACISCGNSLRNYTPGCRRCRDRQCKILRRRGTPAGRRCSGCGTEIDNFTLDCEVCKRRQRKRAQRVEPQLIEEAA